MSNQSGHFHRRRLLLGSAAGALAGLFGRAAPAHAKPGGKSVVHTGLAEVVSGSSAQLTVLTRDAGAQLSVPTQDFPADWLFQRGDLVLLVPSGDSTSPVVAKPFIYVQRRPDAQDVYIFNESRGSRLAAVVPRE